MTTDSKNTDPLTTGKLPSLLLEVIYGLKVKDVMTTEVITATREFTLRKVQQLMKTHRVTGIPIVENGRLFGIISVEDIMNALDTGAIDDSVDHCMTRNVIILEDEMPISLALSYFEKYRFRRFPVLNKENALVGMMTSRDVLNKLLTEMNREVERLEKNIPETMHGNPQHYYREFYVQKFDFETAGKASGETKRIMQSKNFPAKLIRRAAIAIYELEMNLVIHSDGGKIVVAINADTIEITSRDMGPGIKDIALALKEGFTTATDWIRSLGFGAGMGLPNVKRVSDTFDIQSSWDSGTVVKSTIVIKHEEPAHAH